MKDPSRSDEPAFRLIAFWFEAIILGAATALSALYLVRLGFHEGQSLIQWVAGWF